MYRGFVATPLPNAASMNLHPLIHGAEEVQATCTIGVNKSVLSYARSSKYSGGGRDIDDGQESKNDNILPKQKHIIKNSLPSIFPRIL